MRNSTTREEGFLPILVIIIIVAISAASGTTLYYIKERPEQKSVQNQLRPTNLPLATNTPNYSTNYTPSPQPSLKTTKGAASQSPVSSSSPKVQTKMPDSSQNLTQQFATIEQEVLESKAKGSLFSPSHSDRIFSDLNILESKGYLKSELDRLRKIVIDLSPHLKDQAMQSTSPVASSGPSPTPNCLKTNPTLVADITDFSKIQKITAPGSSSSEGPKGHSFIWTGNQRVPIYAPIDMVLDSGSYGKDTADSPAQYLLFFKVKGSCDFQTKFDHVDEPVSAIKQNFSSVPAVADSRTSPVANRVELKAGDLVGYTTGTLQSGNWDFGLYNMAQKGALAESYGMHAYSVCWVDFYSSAKQQQYRSLLEGPKLVCSF